MGDVVTVVARVLAGGTLALAGIMKVSSLDDFAAVLPRFPISRLVLKSTPKARPVAATIAVSEIAIGFALVGGAFLTVSSILGGLLLVAFSTGIAIALVRGERISCGCFGSASSTELGSKALLKNVALLGLVALGTTSQAVSVDALLRGSIEVEAFVLSISFGLQALLLLLLIVTFIRTRSMPGYVKRVPVAPGALGVAWMGAPESRLNRRKRRRIDE